MADLIVTKVKRPIRIIDIEVLKQCSKGLERRIKYGFRDDKERCKIIKAEIDYLIDQL